MTLPLFIVHHHMLILEHQILKLVVGQAEVCTYVHVCVYVCVYRHGSSEGGGSINNYS